MRRRALILGSLGVAATARADDVDAVLRDVMSARNKVRTVIAKLTQERVLSLLSTSVTSRGEMTLVRPDRLRWELDPPDAITYWVSPEGIAYRTPSGSGKVPAGAAGPLAGVLSDLLVVLGGDLRTLRDRHDVTAERRKDGVVLGFSPRDEKTKKVVRRVVAELGADLVSPRKLVLEEPGDDRTTVTFEPARLDETVDPARMRP